MAKPSFYYTNTAIATVPAAGGTPESISAAFDERSVDSSRGRRRAFSSPRRRTPGRISTASIPSTHAVSRHAPAEKWIGSGFSLTHDGQHDGVRR